MTDHHEFPSALRLDISGMHCAGCATKVREAIKSTSGVDDASVNFTSGSATVSGRGFDANNIIQAVENAGYHAKHLAEHTSIENRLSDIELRQARNERAWRHRAIIGLSIWVPLELLHLFTQNSALADWVSFVGATVAILTVGAGFYESAWRAARRLTTNMDTLIALGATTAYVASLVTFLAEQLGKPLDMPLYFAESAALLGIISLGHWLEARSTAKAGSAVRELLELQPDDAELLNDDDSTKTIPSDQISKGDRILIRPGARIPVDGVVIEGKSEVDASVVTGEADPALKSVGNTVAAGCMNTTGRLIIEANVDGEYTSLSRIADLVQEAQSSSAEIQRLADKVSSIFVPAVLVIACVTAIGWIVAGHAPTGIIAAVTVLVISCPCALGLATPMAVMVGAGEASKRGILIKSASALEIAGRTSHIVFDKTGTLTLGTPVVSHVRIYKGTIFVEKMLGLAAAVETPSEHPVARAIVQYVRHQNIDFPTATEFQALPGIGVEGVVEGKTVRVVRDDAFACIVEVDGVKVGAIEVKDQPRDDARQTIHLLQSRGLKVSMLTGDRKDNAIELGAALGLTSSEIVAECSPESKSQYIDSLVGEERESDEGRTMMVGDGINDAAALAAADIGVALSTGTNIAIESADVVIPSSRISAIGETIDLAQRTLRTIRQNLFFAFAYNAAAIPAAAFGLLGVYGPLIAAAAMGLSDITVIGNALRLKRSLRKGR